MKYTKRYRDRANENCGIYMIRNVINGKVYIGQSKNIYWRWISHKSALSHNRCENPHFQFAWNKYGEDNFEFLVIELCDESMLDCREIYWINKYDAVNCGYNIKEGGERHSGWKMTPEQRKHISDALKGRLRSRKHCRNISLAKKEYFKDHISPNCVPVVCLNTGERFRSGRDANQKYPSADVSALFKCCNGKLLSCGKLDNGKPLVWAYESDYIKMSQSEISHRLQYNSGVASGNSQRKAVKCITTGEQFLSCKDAASHYNISVSNLNGCLKGRQNSAGRDPATNRPLYWAYIG